MVRKTGVMKLNTVRYHVRQNTVEEHKTGKDIIPTADGPPLIVNLNVNVLKGQRDVICTTQCKAVAVRVHAPVQTERTRKTGLSTK